MREFLRSEIKRLKSRNLLYDFYIFKIEDFGTYGVIGVLSVETDSGKLIGELVYCGEQMVQAQPSGYYPGLSFCCDSFWIQYGFELVTLEEFQKRAYLEYYCKELISLNRIIKGTISFSKKGNAYILKDVGFKTFSIFYFSSSCVYKVYYPFGDPTKPNYTATLNWAEDVILLFKELESDQYSPISKFHLFQRDQSIFGEAGV